MTHEEVSRFEIGDDYSDRGSWFGNCRGYNLPVVSREWRNGVQL